MKEKGYEKNYMKTISDNLTRRIGYKMEDCSGIFDKLRQAGMTQQDMDLIKQGTEDMKI